MSIGYTIKSVKESLKKGEFSVEEITKEYLERIEKENPKLNAYLSVFNKDSDAEPERMPLSLERGILSGVPCAIKDNILISGEKCTAGSKILKN